MKRVLMILILAALPAFMAAPPAFSAQTDADIRARLIGNWLSQPPKGQPADHMLQVFRADGTSSAFFFKDAACRALLARIDVKWILQDGVLSMIYPEGYQDRDQIAVITANKLTLKSLDKNATYTRIKSKTCLPPKE